MKGKIRAKYQMVNAMIFCTFNSTFGGALQYCLDIPYNERKVKPHHLIFIIYLSWHSWKSRFRSLKCSFCKDVRNEDKTMLKGKTVKKSSPLFKV